MSHASQMHKSPTLAQKRPIMPAPDFSNFPEVSKAEWLRAVQQQLKGRDPGTLGLEVEGIRLDPFAHADDRPVAQPPVPVPGRWTVSEQIRVGSDVVAANRQLLDGLTSGIQAPELVLTEVLSVERLTTLFGEVGVAYIDIHVIDKAGDAEIGAKLTKVLGGNWTGSMDSKAANNQVAAAVRTHGIACAADLAETAAVSQLVEYYERTEIHLRADPDRAARLHYRVPVGRQYLLEIAKLRALRILVAQVCQRYGLTEVPLPVIAAYAHPGAFDGQLYTNMIRWGSLALSAAVGGADRIIAPGLPGEKEVPEDFKRRIARNALHVLQLESRVGEMHDPAAGSFYIEQLTDRLVAAAREA